MSDDTRRRLARAAFAHTAAYDAAIVAWFDEPADAGPADRPPPADPAPRRSIGPRTCATARTPTRSAPATGWRAGRSWWDDAVQHGGKELSYLNLYDAEAAWRLVHELGDGPAAVVIKHANPCGAAVADDLTHGLRAAPTSATRCRPSAASWP